MAEQLAHFPFDLGYPLIDGGDEQLVFSVEAFKFVPESAEFVRIVFNLLLKVLELVGGWWQRRVELFEFLALRLKVALYDGQLVGARRIECFELNFALFEAGDRVLKTGQLVRGNSKQIRIYRTDAAGALLIVRRALAGRAISVCQEVSQTSSSAVCAIATHRAPLFAEQRREDVARRCIDIREQAGEKLLLNSFVTASCFLKFDLFDKEVGAQCRSLVGDLGELGQDSALVDGECLERCLQGGDLCAERASASQSVLAGLQLAGPQARLPAVVPEEAVFRLDLILLLVKLCR